MAKILKIKFPEKCIGCELCVFEIQRQLGQVGLDGAPIRVFRGNTANILGNTTYVIELDPKINDYDIKAIENICPTGVFTVEEGNKDELEKDILEND